MVFAYRFAFGAKTTPSPAGTKMQVKPMLDGRRCARRGREEYWKTRLCDAQKNKGRSMSNKLRNFDNMLFRMEQ